MQILPKWKWITKFAVCGLACKGAVFGRWSEGRRKFIADLEQFDSAEPIEPTQPIEPV